MLREHGGLLLVDVSLLGIKAVGFYANIDSFEVIYRFDRHRHFTFFCQVPPARRVEISAFSGSEMTVMLIWFGISFTRTRFSGTSLIV